MFQRAVSKLSNPSQIIRSEAIEVQSCCQGTKLIPFYGGETWVVDNAAEYYPLEPAEGEEGICHVMGPGNIHLYFIVYAHGNVEVESPLHFLSQSYPSLQIAFRRTLTLLGNPRDFPTPSFLKRRGN